MLYIRPELRLTNFYRFVLRDWVYH